MNEKITWFGNIGAGIFTALQTDQFFQMISLILTCIATALSIAISIYNIYKKAREKKFEAQDLEKLKEEINNLNQIIKDYQNKEEHDE